METTINPAEMPAGRELDGLVAERVMGRCPHREQRRYVHQSDTGFECVACGKDVYGRENCPAYSTSIEAAWQVVEKLKADGWWIAVEHEAPDDPERAWGACLSPNPHLPVWEMAETAPLAICRAALMAVEGSAR